MKNYFLFLAIFFLFGCQNNSSTKVEKPASDSSKISSVDSAVVPMNIDSVLMTLSNNILLCLKKRDLNCLSNYIDPVDGIRFSPYAFIDTARDKRFSKDQLKSLTTDHRKINWGSYAAGENEIIMDPITYMGKFVYDVDFLNAKQKTINKSNAGGTMINNLDSIYPSHSYTEFYFPGFEKKYEGMDWRALRLVFKKENGRFYLVGIVHDEWTP